MRKKEHKLRSKCLHLCKIFIDFSQKNRNFANVKLQIDLQK